MKESFIAIVTSWGATFVQVAGLITIISGISILVFHNVDAVPVFLVSGSVFCVFFLIMWKIKGSLSWLWIGSIPW